MTDLLEAPSERDFYGWQMEFRVLGSLEHGQSDAPTQLGGPKQRAVLAVLISAAGQMVSTDALIDSVWGDRAPKSIRSSLHTYISNLRVAIGGKIERTGSGYRLQVGREAIDAIQFEHMVDEARGSLLSSPEAASETLRAALSLWRGRPYADLIDVPGLQEEIRRLEELRLLAVESRIDADLAAGRHAAVIGELEALAEEHPLREGFRSRHMIALYREGRQAEALRAFNRTRDYLGAELGIEPGSELAELEERILVHDPLLLSARDVHTEEVAFLFTDIEGSTVMWETQPDPMRKALTEHDEIFTRIVSNHNGNVFKHTGDGILASFASVIDAAASATEAQLELTGMDWGELGELKVRMSVDVGDVDVRGGDYFGAPMNRGSRLMTAAHGGQVLLSTTSQTQLHSQPGIQIRSLGEHRLKGLGAPQQIFQLVVPGINSEFPALRLSADTLDVSRQFGDAIRGYEIRERVGVGRFGIVYRAYQPSVGREVAVKVIRPEFANHPAFVRNFENEARLVARLEHPHIVSLYDFWRDHQGAYLVMPFLSGRSLAGSPYGALAVDRVVQIIGEIGSALAYAHRQGVIHRDVKPANILLDGEGNAYLADFGIAVRAVERAAGVASSSQIYRAPEDRSGLAVDERTDVFSLAAVAAELLTGERTSHDDLSNVPDEVRPVIERAMDTDQANRYATIDEFLDELRRTTGSDQQRTVQAPFRNPYKSLHAFEENDARDFFGRDTEVAELLDLVSRARFSTVVGPSGSGKSSLVKAGLIPALRSGRVGGSHDWLIVTMLPGAHPFDELATALADVATEGLGDLASELRKDEHGLMRIGKRIMRDLDGDLLIVIDQFEELYSLVSDDSARSLFISSLIEAAKDPHSRLRLVATIRADFFDQPLLDDQLGPVVSIAHFALAVPDGDSLLESVDGPAAGAGVQFEAGLSHQIVADVRNEPGGLPLMQFVLSDLVEATEDGRVSFAAYTAAGGVTGALSRRADDVYTRLSESDRIVAEQILLRLVTVSDEVEDVRRRVRRSELDGLGLDAGSVDRVLGVFGTARLLTFDRDPITRGPTIEVAHEALLREWERLTTWIMERRESLLIQRRLNSVQDEWEQSGKSLDRLPTGGRLAQFEEWAADPTTLPTKQEHRFLETAVAQRNAQRKSRRRRRLTVTGGFAIAAVIASVLAFAESRSAGLAEARELVLEAERVLEFDPDLSIHLALTAASAFQEAGEDPTQTVTALRRGIAAQRIVLRIPGGGFVAAHPDGQLLATSEGNDVAVWDIESQAIIERYQRPNAVAGAAAFSPDGESLAVMYAGVGSPITVWDRNSNESMNLGTDPVRLAVAPRFSIDGDLVIFETGPNTDVLAQGLEAWSLGDESLVYRAESAWGADVGRDGLMSLAQCPDPDGDVCDTGTVKIVSLPSGEQIASFPLGFMPGFTAWSPDQSQIAASDQTTVVVIDSASGAIISSTVLDRAFQPRWLPSGDSFVVGGESLPRVIEGSTGEVMFDLPGAIGGSWSYEFVPGTYTMVSAGLFSDETLIYDVWPLGGLEIDGWSSPQSSTWNAYYEGDGERVLIADRLSFISSTATGDARDAWGVTGLQTPFFPTSNLDRNLIASSDAETDSDGDGEADGLWSIRDLATKETVYTAPQDWSIRGISRDGSMAVRYFEDADSQRCLTKLIALPSGADIADLDSGCLGPADFSPDGRYVATSNLGAIEIPFGIGVFDTSDGRLVADLEGSIYDGIPAAFTGDGTKLITGSWTGTIGVFDLPALIEGSTLEDALIRSIPAHDTVTIWVRISPDGSKLLTSAFNDPLKVWDLDTGALLGQFGSELEGRNLHGGDFHPTLPRIVVTSPPNEVRIHTLDVDELIDIARARLTRDMTEEECQQYLRRSCG